MGLLDKIFGGGSKTVVLALDGVPYSLLRELYKEGVLENLGSDGFKKMSSVYPTISSVAWSSFMTGKNPGKHNIMGFIDRNPGEEQIHIPDSGSMKAETLWRTLSEHDKRVFVMNVPLTYPPEEVNGKLVSGFLCPDIDKGTYPPGFSEELKELGYRIDADSSLALESTDRFLKDIHDTFDAKKRAMFDYIDGEWDLFMVQFMTTDRINHFLMGDWADDGEYADDFIEFYKKVDEMVGEVYEAVGKDDNLIVMSDHGFTPLKYEVQLNHWLKREGYLEDVNEFSDIGGKTEAYSLLPGRVYINLEDREVNGAVKRERYKELREELMDQLSRLKDPNTGEKIIKSVFKREDIYSGPYTERAADIIIHPNRGYDLKADFKSDELLTEGKRNAMHTYSDAFLYCNRELSDRSPNLLDLFPTILDLMDEEIPRGLDGDSLL